MLSIVAKGSTRKTEAFLESMTRLSVSRILDAAGKAGVTALASATPYNSGLAASSWSYEVTKEGHNYAITWYNSDVENGFPVAIMLQYGYGTGTGGYVQGEDYINPALKPIFDQISSDVWKAVTSA